MILIPKYEDLYNKHPLGFSMGVGGAVRMVLRNSMGGMVRDTGWIPNTVTNYAMTTGFSTTNWGTYIHLGSDNTPPVYSNTTLGNWLGVGTTIANIHSNLGAPSYAGFTTKTARFDTGVATGTIRECGVGPGTSNTNMCIRQIIDPPIVKAADQVLDVSYIFYIFWDYTVKTSTVVVGSDTYDTYAHPGSLDELENTMTKFICNGTSYVHNASGGSSLGTVLTTLAEDNPTDINNSTSVTVTSTGAGSYMEYEVFYGLDEGNTNTGYIKTCDTRIDLGRLTGTDPRYKMRFTNQVGGEGIPKNDTQTITFTWRLSWTRANAHLIPLDFDLTGVDADLTEIVP